MKFLRDGVEVDANGKPVAEAQTEQLGGGEATALQQQLDDLRAVQAAQERRYAEATAELEQLRAQPLLPEDAHDRLIAVKGVGEKLAEEILAALKAPAQEG
ncbi:hypothetical protein [Deinococcus hopiensis]|uniref:Uncharacterized protein n=1 Tax=Deinococcus hopiensis KR-140 TaxID=695939 RepID=A0A1W1VJ10_9DEIO|nr:hypothetical protein [Deinococcus hopiensis]SMB93316.1 hypothetical protein SAMN00790413_01933 [Deinococcus hopiensis KR-140]